MAASVQQKLRARLLLGLTVATDIATMETNADALDPEGLEELDRVLAAARPIMLRQVELRGDVVLDQKQQLAGLRDLAAVLLQCPNAFGGYVGTVEPDADDAITTLLA